MLRYILCLTALMAVITSMWPGLTAASPHCGPDLEQLTRTSADGAGAPEADVSGGAMGFLISARCGGSYATTYLVVDGTSLRAHALAPAVVSAQPDGFWVLEPLTVSMPRDCEEAECRHRGSYLLARRLNDAHSMAALLETITAGARDRLEIAGGDEGTYTRKQDLLLVGQDVVCTHTTARWPTAGTHPAYLDRDGCTRLEKGRVRLGESPLRISQFYSAETMQDTRRRLRQAFEQGRFRGDVPESARQVLGELQLDDPRLLLDYRDGRMMAYAVAEASAPFALSRTYRVEVMVEVGPAPHELAGFDPRPAEGGALERTFSAPAHIFAAPGETLAAILGDDHLTLARPRTGDVLMRAPMKADDAVLAEWAVGDYAIDWEEALRRHAERSVSGSGN